MTMPLTLDHVVILVADLERAIVDYSSLGFTVQRGGTHAAGTTHNALVGFADGSYLELIAFLRPDPAHRWGTFAARGHQGFVDFALLPPSVGEVVARARAAGIDYVGPLDGGRTTLDGQVLKWQIGTPPSPDLPFLCGDITPRALRVREGGVRVHPNGVSGVALITVQVNDLAASVNRYGALLGQTAAAGTGLGAASYQIGPSQLRLRPAEGSSGVVHLTFAGPTAASLPPTQTQGALMDIQPA